VSMFLHDHETVCKVTICGDKTNCDAVNSFILVDMSLIMTDATPQLITKLTSNPFISNCNDQCNSFSTKGTFKRLHVFPVRPTSHFVSNLRTVY